MNFNKSDIITLLASDPRLVSRAIEILGNNQRDDELASRSTNHQNGIGFASNWASSGTHLWQFVTGWDSRSKSNRWGRKCLTHQNWRRARYIRNAVNRNGCENALELGRRIAVHHWRQLSELVPKQVPAVQVPQAEPAPEPKVEHETLHVDYEMIAIPADKMATALAILKAAGIL